ncbi:DUF4054 domain-containing protein [Microvirgula aerodenitrificans]|uniref:DUF4054 domain-containing protein n=1 Tax=Microvirgula aerodenitrificans TaxID=57480 RepID=UPI00248DA8F1|nr:DUF4054 domain-containing protein [Microvirgula aerodenitrificans]
MNAQQLRTDFPEFSDPDLYTDGQITFWLNLGEKLLPPDRWCDLLDQGLELYVAHHLALAAHDQDAAAVGAVPGQVKGPATNKSVDKVSVAHDAGSVTLDGGGFFNLTTYGIRFLTLARIVGAGGIQL